MIGISHLENWLVFSLKTVTMNQTKTKESQNFPAKSWDFSRCNEHTDVDSKIAFRLTPAWRLKCLELEYSDFETLWQQYLDLIYNFRKKICWPWSILIFDGNILNWNNGPSLSILPFFDRQPFHLKHPKVRVGVVVWVFFIKDIINSKIFVLQNFAKT